MTRWFRGRSRARTGLLVVAVCAVLGVVFLQLSKAAGPFVASEAEAGMITGCAGKTNDSSASGGASVRFADCAPGDSPGAHLPISYDAGTISGAIYVAPNGNDSNAGTQSAPYANLSKAISAASSGKTIVLRGGVYRGQAGLSIPANKTLKIQAYPGEIPVLNGARQVTSGWTAEDGYRYIAYTPRPVTNGVMSFTTNQGLAGDGVGKYADQAWQGSNSLKEVTAKTSLAAGTFWVDRTNNRLYMMASDVDRGSVEVTQAGRLVYVFSPDTRIEGLRITRYSENGGEYGLLLFGPDADHAVVKNVEVTENAYTAFFYDGSSNRNDGSILENVTIDRTNWMGVSLNGTDNFGLINSKITNMNYRDEFLSSPTSGAIKTARTWYTKIIGNEIADNHGHGVWFDISNYQAVIANNSITSTTGAGVFYEISDDLLLINNYITSTGGSQPVRLAGSSGLKLVNNTIIGGRDPVGIYTDERSMDGCAKPGNPPCGDWGNLRDSYHPFVATMDWMPRLDLMINNIVAYPTQSGYCGVLVSMCITQRNSTAYVPIQATIHKAGYNGTDRSQTLVNGNIYANGSGNIIAINEPQGRYTTTSAFVAAMAGTPVGIAGFETAGKYGNSYVNTDGSPTAALSAVHGQAVAVPTDSAMNQFIPAGTKHYGVTQHFLGHFLQQ